MIRRICFGTKSLNDNHIFDTIQIIGILNNRTVSGLHIHIINLLMVTCKIRWNRGGPKRQINGVLIWTSIILGWFWGPPWLMKSEHFPELTITEQAYCVDTPQIVLNCLVHCMPRSNRVWPFYPKSFFQTASGSVQPPHRNSSRAQMISWIPGGLWHPCTWLHFVGTDCTLLWLTGAQMLLHTSWFTRLFGNISALLLKALSSPVLFGDMKPIARCSKPNLFQACGGFPIHGCTPNHPSP